MNLTTLLNSLKDHKVRFVIIGATAGVAHGYSRVTRDLDIFIEPTPVNVERLFESLQACGYDLQGTTVAEGLQKKLLFRQYVLETDIHPHVKGVGFADVWKNKVEFELAGTEVFFASLEDLIAMKLAANRPKDQEDLRHLKEIQRQKGKG